MEHPLIVRIPEDYQPKETDRATLFGEMTPDDLLLYGNPDVPPIEWTGRTISILPPGFDMERYTAEVNKAIESFCEQGLKDMEPYQLHAAIMRELLAGIEQNERLGNVHPPNRRAARKRIKRKTTRHVR